jgi:hypothetical protein
MRNTNKGRRLKSFGVPRPETRKPRPHVWKVGPDPVEHKKYLVWLQQRNQANYREEGWELDFELWKELWGDHWLLRGRQRGTWCMSRRDWSLPWTRENTVVITREEHARLQGQAVRNGWRSIAQKKNRIRRGLDRAE